MWHDFVEESEGCGSGLPLTEGSAAIERVGSFLRDGTACRVACTRAEGSDGTAACQQATP